MSTEIPSIDVAALAKRAGKALAQRELSSVDARAAWIETQTASASIKTRMEAIQPSTAPTGAGPVRRETAVTGTASDLGALDAEYDRLRLQYEQLVEFSERLNRRRHEAMAREAARDLPNMLESLRQAVDDLEAAHKAVTARAEAARQVYGLIDNARGLARNAGLPVAAADAELAERFIAVMPPQFARHVQEIFENITGSTRRDHLAAA